MLYKWAWLSLFITVHVCHNMINFQEEKKICECSPRAHTNLLKIYLSKTFQIYGIYTRYINDAM